MKATILKKFFIFSLLFVISYFIGCLNQSSNSSQSSVPTNIFSITANFPSIIYPNQPFNIYLSIQNSKYSEWEICLSSFSPLAYNITGSLCVNNSEVGSGIKIVLPFNGYLELINPNILLNNQQEVTINFCYYNTENLSLEGCLEQNQVCYLNISGYQSPIQIDRAYIIYQNNTYYLYLELSLSNSQNSNLYYITNQNILNSCNINSINPYFYSFNYLLSYELGLNLENESGIGEINVYNNQGTLKIPINYEGSKPSALFDIDFSYYGFKEIYLGTINIQNNT